MVGSSGGDSLTGGTAADTISGGEGNDSIAAGAGDDSVDGGTGNDSIDSGDGNDTVLGGEGNDTVAGGAGNDLVDGGDGDDLVDGGIGADTLLGGAGNDRLIFDPNDISVDGGTGTNTLVFAANADLTNSGVSLSNIGTLDLTGSAEQLTLSYAALSAMLPSGSSIVTVDGDSGDKIVVSEQWTKGATVNGYVEYTRTEGTAPPVTLTMRLKVGVGLQLNIVGTLGDDSLLGDVLNDTLSGGAGNDSLDGGAGADSLLGGSGDDLYTVDNLGDSVVEVLADGTDTGGTDTVKTNLSSYVLPNAVENLIVTGTGGTTATGNGLANAFTSGAGHDSFAGGAGDDIYRVDSGDIVTETSDQGTDTVKTGSSSYTLAANLENLEYNGSASADFTGNDEANQIAGGSLGDTLRGGLGNDTLDGGAGADTLEGGSGDDVYLVDDASDTITEGATEGTDTVQTTLTSYTLQANIENLEYTGSGNATLTGNSDVNRITGGAGSDLLDGGAGADSLLGGLGNDTLVLDASDTLVDGGDGSDTLFLKTATTNFLTGTLPTGIEVIQMTNSVTGGTSSSLTLSAVKVRAMLSSGNDILIVEGDAGDAIEVTEAWTSLGQTVAGYNDYTRATADGSVILRMKAGILLNQVVSDTARWPG
jgi:Ca2+-binding RTX toxin-like protein